jgi:hypothetical protein
MASTSLNILSLAELIKAFQDGTKIVAKNIYRSFPETKTLSTRVALAKALDAISLMAQVKPTDEIEKNICRLITARRSASNAFPEDSKATVDKASPSFILSVIGMRLKELGRMFTQYEGEAYIKLLSCDFLGESALADIAEYDEADQFTTSVNISNLYDILVSIQTACDDTGSKFRTEWKAAIELFKTPATTLYTEDIGAEVTSITTKLKCAGTVFSTEFFRLPTADGYRFFLPYTGKQAPPFAQKVFPCQQIALEKGALIYEVTVPENVVPILSAKTGFSVATMPVPSKIKTERRIVQQRSATTEDGDSTTQTVKVYTGRTRPKKNRGKKGRATRQALRDQKSARAGNS